MSQKEKSTQASTRPDEGFAQRWSRRKLEHSAEAPVDEPVGDEALQRRDSADDQEPVELPDIETLNASSDFSAFLREGVSSELRRRALHKLFHLPEFNLLDGLNDYDEDYTKFEKLGDIVTHVQRRWQQLEEEQEAAKKRAEEGSETSAEAQQADEELTDDRTTSDAIEDDDGELLE